MGTTITRAPASVPVFQPFIAGIIGAVGTDGYISISQHISPLTLWQHIAATALGPVALTSPTFIWAGIALHVVIALFWANLYAYVWSRVNSLHNWVLGGIVLGIVVDVCMDGVIALRGALVPQIPSAVISGLITNVVFYGLLVALYLSRAGRTRA